jgi:tetratricopeptide (TPR) repeat protein
LHLLPPAWTESELGELLRESQIAIDSKHQSEYLHFLSIFSGGHPLVAKALASRCPTIPDLFTHKMAAVPTLADESLTEEVRSLLYHEILTTPDAQNLVQRLSVLVSNAGEELLEALRVRVQPQISTAASVIIDQVGGSVIEGDPINGYAVAFVFREIARQRLSEAERKTVHEIVADALLTPKGRVLDADRTVLGIFYAFCSLNLDKVFFWTTVLLRGAYEKEQPDFVVSTLLRKLAFVRSLPAPTAFNQQFAHTLTILAFAVGYSRLGQFREAAQTLQSFKLDSLPPSDDAALTQAASELRIIATTFRAMVAAANDISDGLRDLNSVAPADLAVSTVKVRRLFFTVLAELVLHNPIQQLSRLLVSQSVEGDDLTDTQYSTALFDVARNIAFRAKVDNADLSVLDTFFGNSLFSGMLRASARATFLTELRKSDSALKEIQNAIEECVKLNLNRGSIWAQLHQIKGDAAYQMEEDDIAASAYRESLANFGEGVFGYAWAAWRLGLLTKDPEMLGIAAANFQKLGHTEYWGRAIGARGATLIGTNKNSEGIDCFLALVDAYFVNKDETTGPAVTISQAHMIRLRHSLENDPIPANDLAFPEITAGLYETVPGTARPKVGPVVAYYTTASAYQLTGDTSKAQACLVRALDLGPQNETDRGSLPLVIKMRMVALVTGQGDIEEIKRCIRLLLACQSADIRGAPAFLAHCLFQKARRPRRCEPRFDIGTLWLT